MVPSFFSRIPDQFLAPEWELMKNLEFGETRIPNKYKALIGVGVHSETKCRYCTLFHQEAAKLFGAALSGIHDDGDEERMGEQSRVLLTHAHPDDESCATGGTIAKYVAEGAHVTVVTCTRGEEGNVAVAKLAHLAADQQDLLGDRRSVELRNAAAALGLDDHRYLGGEGRYRDSGRMGGPSKERPDAFWQADLDEAGAQLAAIIREVRPHVIVTYDSNGGYGHPDHIQTHRVTMRAVQLSSDPEALVRGKPWDVPKVYWCAAPRGLIRGELASLKLEESSHQDMWVDTDLSQYPDGVHDDSEITTEIDISRHFEAKRRALAAHQTQLTVRGDVWVLASGRGMRIQDREWFILVKGSTGVGGGDHGWEDDLFAGLTDRTREKVSKEDQ